MNDTDFEKLVFGMAHQIRNPCGIILANASQILKNKKLDNENTTSLQAIVNSIKYLDARLDEFVEFSKPMILNFKEVSISHLLQEVIAIVRDKSHLQRVRILLKEDKNLSHPKADHQLLLLAFLNIVLNAIEAMPSGGTVSIEAKKLDGNFTFTFKDSGIGIHPKDLPEIFSPFYTTKEGNIGIGLPISKRIIEQHQGNIDISSLEKKGTTVTVKIPA
ncbi:MAG: hypothetical protein HYT97_00005 [Elusimicrobia bacterium]|nr:hypothetical protein [Elusimicrobiota bacterium]